MRTIETPNPIKLSDSLTLSFQQFIEENILQDIQFGKTFDSLFIAAQIKEAVHKTPIQVSEEAWVLLCQIIKYPTNGYQPKFAIHLIPFMQAVLEAKPTMYVNSDSRA